MLETNALQRRTKQINTLHERNMAMKMNGLPAANFSIWARMIKTERYLAILGSLCLLVVLAGCASLGLGSHEICGYNASTGYPAVGSTRWHL